ncbi:hypothetical protein [Flavobacterium aquidurense]|uniref:hypothetical protein n=1 Tax=Flavobacterium aquidurense TaxID=362413 RepID=UPI00285BD405|nr:hypothetical protein [Flavobacterium aquidurense]MDR7372899.1 hypothetical protein [Flavobacterium aquidurense]
MASCSSEDAKSEQFEFLEFEKDVVLPSVNSGDITFLAIHFDENLSNWDLKLTDDAGNVLPVVLSSVKKTGTGYENHEIQRIAFKAAPKNEGVYTLVIKNKTTDQLYTDHFIVRSKTFNKIQYPAAEPYNIIGVWTANEPEPIWDYIYYQNIKNTIQSELVTTGISGIKLENVTTLKEYNIDYSVNTQTKKIEFTVPVGVPEGNYYLSVRYSNFTSAYFEKDILVQEEKLPKVTSINKNTFKGKEIMTLKGSDFRYKADLDLFPGSQFSTYKVSSYLVFTNNTGTGEIELSTYDQDPSFKYMNAEGTEINFPFQGKTSADDFYYGNDYPRTYFEGTVQVRTGAYLSEPIAIRVDFK